MIDPESFEIKPGTVRDYDALARFHYRATRPATIDRVFRVVLRTRSAVGRFLNRKEEELTLGVLVVSRPHLSCAMRNVALSGRYLGLDRTHAARLVNQEVRTISRVIVDPRCRGVGLAVRLVRRALEDATTPYTEAIAAMGRVHPFFERAGMMRFDPPVSREMSRFEAVLAQIECPAWTLASTRAVRARIDRLEQDRRDWFHAELRRFARTRGRGDQRKPSSLPFDETVRLARTRLWSQPVYYIHHSMNHAEER